MNAALRMPVDDWRLWSELRGDYPSGILCYSACPVSLWWGEDLDAGCHLSCAGLVL